MKHYNNREKLALHLLQWHGGGGSGLYAVGSTWFAGKPIPQKEIERALFEIDSLTKREVNFPNLITESDIKELTSLKDKIIRMSEKPGSVVS